MTYMQRYYRENIDYFRWYRKRFKERANARRRERYANDPEYRRKEIERKQRYKQQKETKNHDL